MPDFGPRWINSQPLDKGGQAQTFLVTDAQDPGGPRRVAKIFSNPRDDRKARFLREIEVTETFDHPNVVRSLARGETRSSKWPYFIMPFYERGTLEENYSELGSPLERLRTYLRICEGVQYAHSRGLVHRDIKPANIFIADSGTPVLGDFGLCYRADEDRDGRDTQTTEAIGARKYMPPEWREGRVEDPQATGDIYSLGKVLYWMFQGRVFDGHEDDHSTEHPLLKTSAVLMNEAPDELPSRILASLLATELVNRTVRKKPEDRLKTVAALVDGVKAAIDRMENGGRPLDFNLPKRCLFCASGTYQLLRNTPFPLREKRRDPGPWNSARGNWPFRELQQFVKRQLGLGIETDGPIPICLVCNVCGNIQYFRLDLTADKSGQKWNP